MDPVPSGSLTASSKRSRTEVTRQTTSYPRKRALKACRTCRMRKAKCNNERPICGFCQSLDAVCIYEDSNDISTLDHASQLIVDRLDQVLKKLDKAEGNSSQRHDQLFSEITGNDGQHIDTSEVAPRITTRYPVRIFSSKNLSARDEPNDGLILDEKIITPPCRTSPDAVLDWPIFRSQYGQDFLTKRLFEHEFIANHPPNEESPSLYTDYMIPTPSPINEESVPRLVETFLTRVHIKCPILDIKAVKDFARNVAQDGLRWNASSCLVLIMSALGCIAQPFSDLYDQNATLESGVSSKALHGQALVNSKVYYDAACKRLGLLGSSILATQCAYLCGVYEMYTMHPLRAWKWFGHASNILFTTLSCQNAYHSHDPEAIKSTDIQRLEASIYWSCYKSMCELRTEIPVETSVLATVNYPHKLPTPPDILTSSNSEASSMFDSTPERFSHLQSTEISSDKLHEQAWFFYLTDIILSRLGTYVLLNLYNEPHLKWNFSNLNQMVKAADEFERQLNEWYSTLPEPIQFDDFDIQPNHELRFTVQFRALEIKAWLYRPFLYYALHCQPMNELSDRVQGFVKKAIDSSIHWILLKPVRHRHHGSWFVGRLVLSSALSIIAAVKAGIVLDSLDNWRDIVRQAIGAMEFWAEESPDFGEGKVVLEALYSQIGRE